MSAPDLSILELVWLEVDGGISEVCSCAFTLCDNLFYGDSLASSFWHVHVSMG